MPLPLLAAGAALAGGKLLGGLSDILGGNSAADALKAAQGQARTDLSTGYNSAKDVQNPIYQTGLGTYDKLSGQYNSGALNAPHMDPFKFDPQSVFQDPEYQAQLKSGTRALDNSAERSGDLFSGKTAEDQMKFGQDLFANRSDDLYNRGFNANNTAFNQNLAGTNQQFQQGMSLSNPAFHAGDVLSGLDTGEGTALATNDLGSGQIRAGNILRTSGALGGMAGDIGSAGSDILSGMIPGMPTSSPISTGVDPSSIAGTPGMTSPYGSMDPNNPAFLGYPGANKVLGMGQ